MLFLLRVFNLGMLNAVYQWCFSEVQPNPKTEKGLFLNSVDKGVDHEQSSKLLPSCAEIATSVLNGNFDFQYHFRGEAKQDYNDVLEEDPNWSIEVVMSTRNNYHGRRRFLNGRSKRKLYSHLGDFRNVRNKTKRIIPNLQ